MRSGACTVQQTLTAEAAIVIKNAMGLARRRGHAQTTPLHVAATLLASDTSLLRRACLQSQPHSGSHPLQCRALELCFNVALNRLPAAVQAQPSLSNALIAALKRAQAHQRRGCIEQQQQPLLAVKVEMEQLVISILDDPSVSRVMREAGFYSTHVKSNVEETVGASISYPNSTVSSDSRQNVSRFHEEMGLNGIIPASTLTSWHHGQQQQQQCNVGTQNLCSFRNPKLLATSEVLATRNKDVRSVVEALVTQKRRNTVIVGEELLYAESIVRDLMGRVEAGDVPDVLKTVQFITPQFSSVSFRLLSRDDVDQRVGELRRIIKSCFGGHHGVIVYVGDLTWTLEINQQKATREEYPNYHDNYSPVDHVILELGRILQTFHHADHSPRLWLLATATYQTYMRCNMRQPSLETQWGLQPVTVPAGGLSLSLQLRSIKAQSNAFGPSKGIQVPPPEVEIIMQFEGVAKGNLGRGHKREAKNIVELEALSMGLSLAKEGRSRSLSHVQQIRKGSNKIVTLMADLGPSLSTHAPISFTLPAADVKDRKRTIHESCDNFKTEAMEDAELKEIEKDFRGAESLYKDVSLLNDSVQGISIASLHMMHDLAHMQCRLGNCGHKSVRESTCASNSRTGKFERDDNAID
eukprot:Gb_32221 [translate_table: standard]